MKFSLCVLIRKIPLLLAAIIVSQLFLFPLYSQQSSPTWLRMLPEEQTAIYAVGFSFPYSSLDKTRSEAIANGIHELARYFSVQVRTETIVWSEQAENEVSNVRNRYSEILDSSLIKQINSAYLVAGKYREPYTNIYYVLLRLPVEVTDSTVISAGRNANPPKSEFVSSSVDADKEPSWVNKIPKSSDAIYAVGYEERYSDPTVTRTKSIENARGQLAKIVQMRVSNLLDDWAGRNEGIDLALLRKVSRTVSNATLRGSQVIGFWSNPHTGENFSLVRIFKKTITVSIRKRASNDIRNSDSDKLKVGDVEAAAKKALDDLDKALKGFTSEKE